MQTLQKSPDLAEIRKREVYVGSLDLSVYAEYIYSGKGGNGAWLLVLDTHLPQRLRTALEIVAKNPVGLSCYFSGFGEIEYSKGYSRFYQVFKSATPSGRLFARYNLPYYGFDKSYCFFEGVFITKALRDEIPF